MTAGVQIQGSERNHGLITNRSSLLTMAGPCSPQADQKQSIYAPQQGPTGLVVTHTGRCAALGAESPPLIPCLNTDAIQRKTPSMKPSDCRLPPPTPHIRLRHRILLWALLLGLLTGCASMATQQMASNLASAMLNQDDPDTVRAGAPAYLLLLDGLIREHPDDLALLMAGSRLYGALASGLIRDPARIKRMTSRSREYAQQALCIRYTALCQKVSAPYAEFVASADQADLRDPKLLYTYAVSWAGWIAARNDNWGALADLPKAEHLLERIIGKAPDYDHGRAQLYLGVIRTQLPPALGGNPETGRRHFELAIRYSKGRDLIAKVEYARRYARLVFNRALHDRLLKEVLEAPANAPDLTLSNILAKQQAEALLKEDYF